MAAETPVEPPVSQAESGVLAPVQWTPEAQKQYRKLKTALNKAIKAKDWPKVIQEADRALAYFEANAYPDDWSAWERAKDDAELQIARTSQLSEGKKKARAVIEGLFAAPLGRGTVRELERMTPVLADSSVFAGVEDRAELRRIGEREYAKLIAMEPVNRRDGRKFAFTFQQFKKPKSHSADPRIMKLIPSLPALLENAVLLDSSPEAQPEKYNNITAWHTYAARALLDGQPLFVQLSTFTQNGVEMVSLYHDHNVLPEEAYHWGKENGGSNQAGPTDSVTNQAVSQDALAKNRLFRLMTGVNDGLKAAPLSETFTQAIPQDRFMALMDAAHTLYSEGVNTPESLASAMDEIAPDNHGRKFVQSFWFALKAVGANGAAEPDWAAVYRRLDNPTAEADGSTDASRPRSLVNRQPDAGETGESGESGVVPEVGSETGTAGGGTKPPAGQRRGQRSSGLGGGRGVSSDPSSEYANGGSAQAPEVANEGKPGNLSGNLRSDAPVIELPENEADRNARIDPEESVIPKSAAAKVSANFAATDLLKKLEDEGRNPTTEEKRVLLAYSGWGAFKGAFDDAKAESYESISGGFYDHEWAQGEDYFKRHYSARHTSRDGVESPSPYDLYSWNKRHGDAHRKLKEKFSPAEYDAAKRSVLNAHYTTPAIIRSMWGMLERLGFKGGKVLEPSGGVGHYIGTQPQHLAERSQWSAVELDKVTSRILSKLYPQARVNSVSPSPSREVTGQGFEEARIANNSLDLVISNVPFHEKGPWQSKKQFGIALNLHNYFFARAMEKVKPGGLVAFITSSSTMENNASQRQLISSMGDLIAAVRLPNSAFKENAGTEVTTDIIILRKPDGRPVEKQVWAQSRVVGRDSVEFQRKKEQTVTNFLKSFDSDGKWGDATLEASRAKWEKARLDSQDISDSAKTEAKAAKEAESNAWKAYLAEFERAEARSQSGKLKAEIPVRVNEYFANHPEHAFGVHSLQGSMYRANEYTLAADPNGPSIEERFKKLIESLPQNIMGNSGDVEIAEVRDVEKGDKPFSFVERDGKIWQVEKDSLLAVDWSDKETKVFQSWLNVREAARALIAAELNPESDESVLGGLRAALNNAYDTHIRQFGPISKTGRGAHHDHISEDPDFPLTTALEEEERTIDAKGKTRTVFNKADIFTTRMNKPLAPPTTAESVQDALTSSLVWIGYPNAAYMGKLLGRDGESVMAELSEKGLIFRDPKTGEHVIRDAYLSGHVQGKLEAAREAMEDDPAMVANVAALEAALPERKNISKIGINLGSPWIPIELLEAYATEELGLTDVKITNEAKLNFWDVQGYGSSEKFSTKDIGTRELLLHALTLTAPKITKVEGSGKDRRVVPDPAGTQLANTRLDAMKKDFEKWIKTSEHQIDGKTVQEIAEKAFNEKANGHVRPNFGGEHITLPGASEIVYRNGIRRSAIARMISQGGGMIAHGVGFGKTFTLVSLAMELKRLGRANRPMIVVENATLQQFAASFRAAYPNANLLVADEKSFSAKNRKRFVARIATGNYDCIVMAHSQFNLIPNHPDVVNNYINSQIQELEELRKLSDSTDKRAVAALESAKISLENQRQSMLDDLKKRQDSSMFWEDLGVDTLLVDEAHRYKNAPVITKMTDIKNVPTGIASQRAIGMTLKVNSIQSRNGGRGIYFATGTPVTNTMAEAYIMMRFTNPEMLREQGIENFDGFAALYGQVVTKVESTWKGKLASVTRFAKFVNGGALMNLIGASWDVQMDPELAGIKRPEVANGGSELVILPPGPSNSAFNSWVTNTVADQWDDPLYWEQIGGKKAAFEENPWMGAVPIMTMQAGVAAALDVRLIDSNAADHPDSKVNTAVRRVLENYHSSTDRLGTQAIFCDLRKPFGMEYLIEFAGDPGLSDEGISEKGSFDLYRDIVTKLVQAGIPKSEIAIVGSDVPKEKRSEIFEKVNSGAVRVVIGSSDTMGIGVNMQERLFAIHHLRAAA